MKSMNSEIKKVVNKMKDAQEQLQHMLKSQSWVEDARKYAERQGKEVKKLFGPDVDKLKGFLERERKELERFQKQIPGEVKKIRKFLVDQRKDFEKMLVNVKKMSKGKSKKTTRSGGKKTKMAKKQGPSQKKSGAAMAQAATSAESASNAL